MGTRDRETKLKHPSPTIGAQQNSRKPMFSVIDLFCGTGGISYGFKMADSRFQIAAAVDIDLAATRTAKANHLDAAVLTTPLEKISSNALANEANLTEIDIIVGGPPCQGFSSLRPSRGTTLDDPRNRLYREYQRIVRDLQPRIFILENVVGLVNASKGNLLGDLIKGFEKAGYRTDWRILNAAHYGVPQKRERFFLIGVRNDVVPDSPITFPVPTHSYSGRTIGVRDRKRLITSHADAPAAVTAWEAISDLPSVLSGQSSDSYRSDALNTFQRKMRGSSTELTLHTATSHSAKMLEVISYSGSSKAALPEGLVTSGYSSCYSRIDPNEPAPTVTVKFTSPASSKCIHPFDNRAITPREAARIQSFPDSFIFEGTKTEIASQLGNAVPPLLASALVSELTKFLST
jgi:DNA (cytosine-5)-methyltransferase 1